MTLSDRSLISHFQKKKGMIKAAPNFSAKVATMIVLYYYPHFWAFRQVVFYYHKQFSLYSVEMLLASLSLIYLFFHFTFPLSTFPETATQNSPMLHRFPLWDVRRPR